MADADTRDVVRRPVRSYVLRQGRLSPAQARALDELAPRWSLPYEAGPLDFAQVFGRRAPVAVVEQQGDLRHLPRRPRLGA